MLTTATCTKEEETNLSIMAIEASKLDYRTQVRATAEELWNRPENPSESDRGNSVGTTNRKKGDATVTDDDSISNDEDSNEGSDEAPVGRPKSRQPSAGTPPLPADDRWH